MKPERLGRSIALGLLLAVIPFARYFHVGDGEAHSNHEARHGGQLGMVGDHHIEVRRRQGRVEAFVSDASRRPVRPEAGWIVFDGGERVQMRWEGYRLVAPDRAGTSEVETLVLLAEGDRLSLLFDFRFDE